MNKYKSLLTITMAALMLLCCAIGWGCSKPSAADADDRDVFSEQTGGETVSETTESPDGTGIMLDSLPTYSVRTLRPIFTPTPEPQQVFEVNGTSTPDTDMMEVSV